MPVVDVDRLKEQSRRFVDGFTPGQKAMTILGVVAVVLAGMTFMKWAAKPDMAPLYTGLSSQDAGAVTTALDAQHISYKIAGGGGTILVPRQDVDKTRIDLSAKNIPSGGDSFVLLDKQGITTDQFTRNIDYQRALQGELGKAIESIDSIAAATVTLTIPQQTVFVGATEDKPTAAVLVKTTGGTLSADTVNAIVHLVASSIPNMNPDDVTVADASGAVLHAPGMDTQLAGSSQIAQAQNYDATVEKKIEDMVGAHARTRPRRGDRRRRSRHEQEHLGQHQVHRAREGHRRAAHEKRHDREVRTDRGDRHGGRDRPTRQYHQPGRRRHPDRTDHAGDGLPEGQLATRQRRRLHGDAQRHPAGHVEADVGVGAARQRGREGERHLDGLAAEHPCRGRHRREA